MAPEVGVAVQPTASAVAPLAPASTSATGAPHDGGTGDALPAEFDLAVDEYDDPTVIEPPLAVGARYPVVVAVHGISSMPESVCEPLREGVGARAFVLCPSGIAMGYDGAQRIYQFGGSAKLWDEIEAGLEALRERYGAVVNVSAPIYVGFSQGAILGVDVVAEEGDIHRAIFVEGGHDDWAKQKIESFAKRGGVRVLFLTGSPYWETRARAAVSLFEGTKISLRHVHVDGEGHHFSPRMVDVIERELDWLVEGDERW